MSLYMLCGIPGSGKSTISEHLSGHVVSTDSIRNFLWQDAAIVKHDALVFQLVENIIDYLLGNGENVIFDATNLTVKIRRKYIELAKAHHAPVILHWVDCSLATAIERNAKRDRKVPVPVIKGLYKSFQRPEIEEGFAVIKVYGEDLHIREIISAVEIN